MCDQISDAILDAHLAQDPDAKVACGKTFISIFDLRNYGDLVDALTSIDHLGDKNRDRKVAMHAGVKRSPWNMNRLMLKQVLCKVIFNI